MVPFTPDATLSYRAWCWRSQRRSPLLRQSSPAVELRRCYKMTSPLVEQAQSMTFCVSDRQMQPSMADTASHAVQPEVGGSTRTTTGLAYALATGSDLSDHPSRTYQRSVNMVFRAAFSADYTGSVLTSGRIERSRDDVTGSLHDDQPSPGSQVSSTICPVARSPSRPADSGGFPTRPPPATHQPCRLRQQLPSPCRESMLDAARDPCRLGCRVKHGRAMTVWVAAASPA